MDPNIKDNGLRMDNDKVEVSVNFKIMTIMKAIGNLEYLIYLEDIFIITNNYMKDKFIKSYQMAKVFY